MSFSRTMCRLASSVVWLGLVGLTVATLSGCGGGSSSTTVNQGSFPVPGTTPFVNGSINSRSACTANPHQAGRAAWTVLVYMNAASNLQPDSLINIAQMASVGSNSNLNIVVQWKQTTSAAQYFSSVTPQTTPSFIGTRRYYIKKHPLADLNAIAPAGVDTNAAIVGNTTSLDPDRLADPATDTLTDSGFPTADMGSYLTLKDFIRWGETNYPADHIALVIWDHGSGALNVDNRSARYSSALHSRGVLNTTGTTRATLKKVTRGLSQDTHTGNQIATQELSLALANAPQPIDEVIIDCSLQGTTEVAYQLHGSARVFVGTEESPPGAGYPYDTWLAYVQANSPNPCDSGANLINDTIATYPTSTNITESMVDLSQMPNVATALNNFGYSLNNHVFDQATLIQTQRQAAQYFDFSEYKDLYSFANLIRTAPNVPVDLSNAAAAVQSSLYGTNGAIMISQHGTAGNVEAGASGLSIFLPGPLTSSSVDATTGYDPQWANLGIHNVAPNWATFLQNQRQ